MVYDLGIIKRQRYISGSTISPGTGGTVVTTGSYIIHTFTSSGVLSIPVGVTSVDYLIVAGGGGGGSLGGGGGAGGLLQGTVYVTPGTYSIVIGGGGSGATNYNVQGNSGNNTTFKGFIAIGGGAGGSYVVNAGLAGGSGGGASGGSGSTAQLGGAGTAGQGFAGGNATGDAVAGGGGAGGAASNVTGGNSGNGGVGLQSSISGTATYYAGGGGGGSWLSYYSSGTGGLGGGGNGSLQPNPSNGFSGTANSGGGGGGGGYWGSVPFGTGGTGGSGIVIARYSTTGIIPPYDTSFVNNSLLLSNQSTAPAFASDGSANRVLMSVLGDTRPSRQNPFNFGYYSNYFDGTAVRLTTAASPTYNLTGANLTLECWVYMTATPSVTNRLITIGANSISSSLYLGIGTDRSVTVSVPIGGGAGVNSGANLVPLNIWTHIAFTLIGTTGTLYLNGTQVAQQLSGWTMASSVSNYFYVGYDATAPVDGKFTGYVSNVRLVKGIAVYTGNFTPPTSPLGVTQSAGTNIAAIPINSATSVLALTCQADKFIDSSYNTATTITPLVASTNTQISSNSPFQIPGTITSTPNSYSNYFNGSTSYLSIPPIALGTNSFTIEMWIYANTTPAAGGQNIFDTRPASTNGVYPLIYFASDRTVRLWVSSADRITSSVLNLNTWYHLALVRRSGTTTMYINGVATGSSYADSNNYLTSALLIGASYGGGAAITAFFNGYISNLRVINGTGLYTTTFTTPVVPLTAVTGTSLLTCNSNRFVDGSTNNFAITPTGSPTLITFNPFLVNNSLYTNSALSTDIGSGYFDGAGDYLNFTNANNQITFATGNFTIEFWVNFNNPRSTTSYEVVLRNYNADPFVTDYFYLGKHPSATVPGAMSFWVANFGGSFLMLSDPTLPSTGWTHFAIVRNGTTWSMYRNGTAVHSVTSSISMGTRNNNICQIGVDLSGSISNLRVVKGTAVYTSNFQPSFTPLTYIEGTSLLTLQTTVPVNNRSFVDSSVWNNLSTSSVSTISQGTFSPYGSNWSTYFNGSSDYFTLPAVTGSLTTNDFTVEFWWNSAGLTSSAFATQVSQGITGSPSAGAWSFGTRFNSTNAIWFAYYNGSSFTDITSSSVSPNDNLWHHIAASRQSNTLRLFIDGALMTTATVTQSLGTADAVLLGYNSRNTGYIAGYVSNLRITKGTALYTTVFDKPTSPLNITAGTSLLTFASNRFNDVSGVSTTTNFTVSGTPNIKRFSPFAHQGYDKNVIGGSMYSNGSTEYLDIVRAAQTLGTNWTIECWFYATGAGIVFDCRPSATNGFYPQFNVGSATAIGFHYNNTNNAITVPGVFNQWNHVAVVKNSGTIRVYFNGVSVYSVADANSVLIGVNRPRFASNGFTPLDFFPGYISDFRIASSTAIYTANFIPPTAPLKLTADTALLLNMTNAAVIDATMQTALSTVGDARLVSTNERKFNLNNMYFDGTGDTLNIYNNIHGATGTGNFTVEAWIYTTVSSGTQCVYDTRQNDGSTTGFYFGLINSNALLLYTSGAFAANGGTVPANTWTHIALTRIGNNFTGYINGTSVCTGTSSNNFTNTIVQIGSSANVTSSSVNYFNGFIDDLRVTRGVARYTANFTVATEPPKLR